MAELSRQSGVPVPTIKFYLREGLLTAAERPQANQSEYDSSHVRRLRLIRAMVQVAQVPLATVKAILEQVDSPDVTPHNVFGAAQQSVSTHAGGEDDPVAVERLERLLTERGWQVSPDNPGRKLVPGVLSAYRGVGADDLIAATLEPVADAAEIVARADIAAIAGRSGLAEQVEGVVIGTALGDVLYAGLRRIAQEAVSAAQFGTDQDECSPAS